MAEVTITRVYDEASGDGRGDGYRVLVDRLWPRGVRKDALDVDLWAKDVAPSTELRRWFHDGGDEAEFERRYLAELDGAAADALAELRREVAGRSRVTLLTAAKEPYAHAVVLRRLIG